MSWQTFASSHRLAALLQPEPATVYTILAICARMFHNETPG